MRTVNVAMVGCGYFGRFQLAAWRSLAAEGAHLAAVCDRDAEVAERAATEFGAPRWYSDAARMFAMEQIDLVDIATRMASHRELLDLSLAHGVATIVQKPMAAAYDDCAAMVEAARSAGQFFAVHENFRFQRPIRRVRDILRSGEVGQASWASIGLRTGLDVYRTQPYFYDGQRLVILDLGIHILDLARFLLGEVAHVSAETQQRNPRVKGEDTATMLLRHTSGAVSLAECTYENRRSQSGDVVVEIEAEKGGIDLLAGGEIVVTSPSSRRREQVVVEGQDNGDPPRFVHDSVRATCREILEAFRAERPAETSGVDNLKTFALVEAAYAAAASGRSVVPQRTTL